MLSEDVLFVFSGYTGQEIFEFKTVFTRCRHILKTVKDVTAAKFELAFTRCRFHKSFVKIYRFQNLPAKNLPFSCEREAYPSHFSPFSMCRHSVNAV